MTWSGSDKTSKITNVDDWDQELDKLENEGTNYIIGADWCPYCYRAAAHLIPLAEQQGKKIEFIELENYPGSGQGLREAFKRRHNGWRTMPMIFINKQFVGGASDAVELERKEGGITFG